MRTVIKGGFVVDPKNGVNSKQNIIIENGRVAALTPLEPGGADAVVDAEGKVVSPGFIDIHMHEDPIDEASGDIRVCIFDCMLRMGVTTVVAGNCGQNVCEPADYLDIVDRVGAPVNVAMLAGHTMLRNIAGARDKYARITAEQLEALCKKTEEQLDRGCAGISYGLRYVPGTGEEELHSTARLCRKGGKMIAAHIRDDAEGVFAAADELIEAGRKFGLNTQISHIGSMAGFGQMERFLQKVDAERANGLRLHCDCYPYYAFSTRIGETTYDEGFLERYRADYSVVELCEGKYRGRSCTKEIFDELRRDAVMTLTVCRVMLPEEIDMAVVQPGVMIASDGLLSSGQGHPRAAGCFPRFLGKYAGSRMPLYDAVAKITALPAEKAGLHGKGGIGVGADADIVIFDPAEVRDNSTFEAPTTPPSGISCVMIGGEVAFADGKIVNDKLGRSLRL